MKQLHHQRISFEQAVEAAWTTWTQSRDLALDTAAANAAAAAEAFEGFLATKLGEWEAAAAAARADLAERIAAKGEAIKAAAQESTRAFAEKQAYKRHYIAGLADQHKKETLTAKVDLEDKLYSEAVKGIWTGYAAETDAASAWLDEFLDARGAELTAAQDQVGEALADAMGEALQHLGDALQDIGDAFFQAKHDEVERLMNALYGYGYEEYKEGYVPTFKHEDEEMEDPYVEDHDAEAEEEVVVPVEEEEEEEEEEVVVEEEEEEEPTYHPPEPSEPTYYPPEPSEPTYVPPPVSEPSVPSEPSEPSVASEPTYYPPSDSESTISVSSESSYHHFSDSESESRDHHVHTHYDHVKPYRPPASHHTHDHAPDKPARVSPPVVVNPDGDDNEGSGAEVEINIYNGVGGSTVLGLGGSIDCAPREGECRPQCPEV